MLPLWQVYHKRLCSDGKTPKAHNISRFRSALLKHLDDIEAMFPSLCDYLYGALKGFGEELAIDSKWVESAANRVSKRKKPDGRSETEARKGVKTYKGKKENASTWEKVVTCFGFKKHSLVDAVYELPVAHEVTDAAVSDISEGKKLIEGSRKKRSKVMETAKYLMADKEYNDTELIETIAEEGVKAVINKRDIWKTQMEKEVPGY